jgi:gluconolactonase
MNTKRSRLWFIVGILLTALTGVGSTIWAEDDVEKMKPVAVAFEKVVDGLEFPEGPAWDGKGTLYFSDCYGNAIYQVTPEGASVFLAGTIDPFAFQKTNGLAVGPDGGLYACEFEQGAILRISPDKKVEVYAAGYQGKKFNRPNYLAFDAHGNLYFTDPHEYSRENPDGIVYRIDKEKREVMPVAEGLGFPNGIIFSLDGKQLYVAESAFHRVLRFDVLPNGRLESKTVFAEMPGGDPDGMNFDSEGNLYVAHFGGGAIHVFSSDGLTKRIIKAPGSKPSNVEFAGEDLRTLYVTENETKAVYRTQVEVPGATLSYLVKKKIRKFEGQQGIFDNSLLNNLERIGE